MKISDPKTIVVFNYGHLGDVLGSFSALKALRERWPEARIVNVAPPGPLSLLENSPLSDVNISNVKKWYGFLKMVLDVRRQRPSIVLCLAGSRRVAIAARLSGAANRVGFAPTKYDWGWNVKVDYPPGAMPAPQHDLKLVEAIGCKPVKRDYVGLLHFTSAEREKTAKWLEENGVKEGESVIGINMGASDTRRQWGVDRFAEVAKVLKDEAKLLVFGGPQDKTTIEELEKLVGVPLLSSAGKFTPRESAALMEYCSLLITNDTGPMHFCMAVGTPVVALFGMVEAGYRLVPGYHHIGLEHNAVCAGTMEEKRCRFKDVCQCMRDITSDEVVNAARTILAKTGAATVAASRN